MTTEKEKQMMRFVAGEEYHHTIDDVGWNETVVNATLDKFQRRLKGIEAME